MAAWSEPSAPFHACSHSPRCCSMTANRSSFRRVEHVARGVGLGPRQGELGLARGLGQRLDHGHVLALGAPARGVRDGPLVGAVL